MMLVTPPTCDYCQHPTRNVTTSFSVTKNGEMWQVRHVPAYECTYCGQEVFDDAVLKRLEELVSGKYHPHEIAWTNVMYWEGSDRPRPAPTSSVFVVYQGLAAGTAVQGEMLLEAAR